MIIIYILYHFYTSFIIHLMLHGCFFYVYVEFRSKSKSLRKNVEIDVKETIVAIYFKI